MTMNDSDLLRRILTAPLSTVAEFYAGCLGANPRAVEFTQEELSLNDEQASQSQIGFADRTLGARA